MRLASIEIKGERLAGIVTDNVVVPVREMNSMFGLGLPDTFEGLVKNQKIEHLRRITHNIVLSDLSAFPVDDAVFSVPVLSTSRLWHVISGKQGSGVPVQHDHYQSLLSHNGEVMLPDRSNTGLYAGMAVIMGRMCTGVTPDDVQDMVLGYTPFVHVTNCSAESMKARETLFDCYGFGPWIATHDEVKGLDSVSVSASAVTQPVVRETIFFSFVRKEIARLSKTVAFYPGDIVFISCIGSIPLVHSGGIQSNITTVGGIYARVVIGTR